MANQLQLLKTHFVSNTDWFAVTTPSSLTTSTAPIARVPQPLTDHILQLHLEHVENVHTYLKNQQNLVKLIVVDFDQTNASNHAYEFLQYLLDHSEFDQSCILESTGGRGYHTMIELAKPIPCNYANHVAQQLVEEIGIPCEILASSPHASYGHTIQLPWGLNRRYHQESKIIYPTNLDKLRPFKFPDNVFEIAKTLLTKKLDPPVSTKPCIEHLWLGVEHGSRDIAAFTLTRYYWSLGLPLDQTMVLLKTWNNKNKPPLQLDVINRKVRTIYHNPHGSRFCCKSITGNPLLKQHCDPKCPLNRL